MPGVGETSSTIEISAGEQGIIRLFQLDMRPEQLAFVRDEEGALAQLLGIETLDMAQADLFDVADLEELGVMGYLTEGCGIAVSELRDDADMLKALSGPVLVLRSRAFGGESTRLTPSAQITLLRHYEEPSALWSARPVTAASAKPQKPKVPPRQARAEARRLGFIFFVVVMSLFVLLLAALIF